MRIAISALVGMTVTLPAVALAQQPPSSPPPAPASPAPPAQAPEPVEPPGETERVDLAGWHDGFFIRDARDRFRFYPRLLVEADFYSSFGPGVVQKTDAAGSPLSTPLPPDVAAGLKPRLQISRARVGFDAELWKRWSVAAILEFGGQQVGNASGEAETSAAGAQKTPTASTGRYAPVQSIATAPAPADVFIGFSVCKCFNIQVGAFSVPFSLDNRTVDDYYPLLERPVAIRSFVVPSQRDVGGMIWGELGPRVLGYELGVFGGDGQNRPSVDARVDFVGRVFLRPFAGGATSDFAKHAQIGVSARHGDRDPTAVGYDAPAITTGQGFVLWKPTYIDSQGHLIHVIPSSAQNEIGGELRLQAGRFAFQGEGYYVVNGTREAIDGTQLTNTERYGRILGGAWYAQLSMWPYGDAFLTPEPGIDHPRHLDLAGRPRSHMPHGLEVIFLVSGINASYRGAARGTLPPDLYTPAGDITVYQAGLAANYWYSKHARFGVDYMAYVTPGSSTVDNQAVVPDNLTSNTATGRVNSGHVLHELGARLAVAF